jgi:peptidoglycan/LPS O-acetylase OafA/YrhL
VPARRDDIQALRGLAVLLVVAYHAGLPLHGGFIGVDVFFVISGFVIGRQLLGRLAGGIDSIGSDRDRDGGPATSGGSDSGGSTLGRLNAFTFYSRRAQRLLPALAVTSTVVVLLAPAFAPVGTLEASARTAVAAAVSVANLYLLRVSSEGYFDPAAELNPLAHTWSLSLEEQLYLVVPWLLAVGWLASRRAPNGAPGDAAADETGPSARLPVVALVVTVPAAASFVANVALADRHGAAAAASSSFAFFSPVTRFWEFAVGLLLAMVPAGRHLGPRQRWGAVAVGCATILAAAITYSDTTAFPGVAALAPVLGAGVILFGAVVCRPDDGNARVAALTPLVRLGDVSYGWYLWHWPLVVFAQATWPGESSAMLAAAVVSLVPAALSLRFLERRTWATHTPTAPRVARLVTACVAVPVLAAVLTLPARTAVAERLAASGLDDASAAHLDQQLDCDPLAPLGDPGRSGCRAGDPDGPRVVLIGDSNAGHFAEAFAGASEQLGLRLEFATADACPFVDLLVDARGRRGTLAQCEAFVRGSMDELRRNPPRVVVVANATDLYVHDDAVVARRFGSDQAITGRSAKAAAVADALTRTLRDLRSTGARVILVNVVPKPWAAGFDLDVRQCSALRLWSSPERCRLPDYPADQPVTRAAVQLERRAADRAGVSTWDVSERVCPAGVCSERIGETTVWAETFHLSVAASEGLADDAADLLSGTY